MPGQNNEQGSILLVTVVFILIITVMGLVATQTSVFEIKISENNRQYFEEMASAEAALNHAMAKFRNLEDYDPNDLDSADAGDLDHSKIETVLNDFMNPDATIAVYLNPEYMTEDTKAQLEVRRIDNRYGDSPHLSIQANSVPKNLSHRYYAGSIDKRRFAMTVTAYSRDGSTVASTWVQKGFSVPAEQDRDLF